MKGSYNCRRIFARRQGLRDFAKSNVRLLPCLQDLSPQTDFAQTFTRSLVTLP